MDTDSHFLEVKAGEYVFRAEETGREMFIIERGAVELLSGSGPQERRLARLGPGDCFGEMAVLSDRPRAAAARAMEECRLLRIDAAAFEPMLRQRPEIATQILWNLARRLPENDPQIAAAAPPPPPPLAAMPMVPRLVHLASGTEFPLAEGETLVGRYDPSTGTRPAVDLEKLDTQHSLSRRHARILREGNACHVWEEPNVANGTFLRGQTLRTGEPVEMHDGDEISFGLVRMIFRAG